MRIGEFSKSNHTTIDTVRHYIEMNLITPQKLGSQFDFDNRCQQDFDDVIRLKSLGFSLQAIQTIFIFKRVGRLSGYEKSLYYQSLFINKANALTEEIKSLTGSLEKLNAEIAKFEVIEGGTYTFGVPLESLSLIRCSKCHSPLQMTSGTITDSQITFGQMQCACGESYQIEDGILMTSTALCLPENSHIVSDIYLEEYIQNTDYDYLLNIHQSYEWIYSQPSIELDQSKLLLELGIGHGFFMRLLSDKISTDAVYVGVDRDLHRLQWLKNRFLHNPPPFKLLLIASDFRDMPLAHRTFDTLLDLSGSSNYGFENEDFLLTHAEKYLTKKPQLLASFLLFKNFSKNSRIPKHLRHQFTENAIFLSLSELGYSPNLSFESKAVKNGGIYENYFVEGESVYTKIYYCKSK